ncbi:hypothetical protein TKK_0001320 [Trichogramma kaykai]|uniref:Mitochondrial ribonuclease P catalytic subunit n=1 Tax=Trichogramma kaykai TaxID=54128 RepID=A0ABD2WRC8_9HYME
MSLFMRSSICFAQCTKRLLNNAVRASKRNYNRPAIRKVFRMDQIREKELLINKLMIDAQKNNDEKNIDNDTWTAIREEMQKEFPDLNDKIDSIIYDLCLNYGKPQQAINFYKYLRANNVELQLNIVGKYLRAYSQLKRPVTKDEERDILETYNALREDYPLLGAKSCEDCIVALCMTKHWELSFELLDMICEFQEPGPLVHSAIMTAAFKNNDPQKAWKLISGKTVPLTSSVHISYLDYCQRNFKGEKLINNVMKMLHFWRDQNLVLNQLVVDNYKTFFESLNYVTSKTSVSKNGICSACKTQLTQTTLSQDNFKILSDSVMKKLIVGKNVFCTTSPQELKRYMLFIKSMKSYDIVIDGLNVAFAKRKFQNKGSIKNIIEVVRYFQKYSPKKVLVVGRAHMNWWSKEEMESLRSVADVFLTKNLSADDPFLLHLTLLSGSNTYFVSRDLMRQHLHLLRDSKLKRLFKRWQMSRQYLFNTDTETKNIILHPPPEFELNTQEDMNGIHIPFTELESLILPRSYTVPENWLCVRKR